MHQQHRGPPPKGTVQPERCMTWKIYLLQLVAGTPVAQSASRQCCGGGEGATVGMKGLLLEPAAVACEPCHARRHAQQCAERCMGELRHQKPITNLMEGGLQPTETPTAASGTSQSKGLFYRVCRRPLRLGCRGTDPLKALSRPEHEHLPLSASISVRWTL